MFVRGGNSNFNKVLIDGVPANDIGGGFDFSQSSTAGVDRVEVLRGGEQRDVRQRRAGRRRQHHHAPRPHACPGAHILARRRQPRHDARTTWRSAARSGRFDYFSTTATSSTDNDVPNNDVSRTARTPAGSAWRSARGTDLSGTVRRVDTSYGSPNAILYYGIADDSSRQSDDHLRRRRGAIADDRPRGRARSGSASTDADVPLHQPDADRASRSIRSGSAPTISATR